MRVLLLQYAKSIMLARAQALILEGKNTNEVGYLAEHNSFAQLISKCMLLC